jgi:hypothetical protein
MRAPPPGRLFLAILFFPGWAGFAGCSRHPEVTVRNHFGVMITDVEISGTGFSKKLGDIGPGHNATTAVRPATSLACASPLMQMANATVRLRTFTWRHRRITA